MPGQFDPMQIDFLTAIRPLEANLAHETSLGWYSERARYLGGGLAAITTPATAVKSAGTFPTPSTSVSHSTGKKKKKKKKKARSESSDSESTSD